MKSTSYRNNGVIVYKDKVRDFCIADEFDKDLNAELAKNLQLSPYDGNQKSYRNRKADCLKAR